jgi:hypothetical protein
MVGRRRDIFVPTPPASAPRLEALYEETTMPGSGAGGGGSVYGSAGGAGGGGGGGGGVVAVVTAVTVVAVGREPANQGTRTRTQTACQIWRSTRTRTQTATRISVVVVGPAGLICRKCYHSHATTSTCTTCTTGTTTRKCYHFGYAESLIAESLIPELQSRNGV